MSDPKECLRIGDAWVCVKAAGHAGQHWYEMRPSEAALRRAREEGEAAGVERAAAWLTAHGRGAIAGYILALKPEGQP